MEKPGDTIRKRLNHAAGFFDRTANPDSSTLTRRGFCNGLLVTGAGLVLAAEGAMSKPVVGQTREVGYPPMKIEGAAELLPGTALLFNYPRACDPAILARTDDGSFHAFSQKCSHLGCSIYFSRVVSRLECPCHRGAFDVKNGLVVNGPPKRSLDEILLQMRGDQVWAVGRRTDAENPIIV